ncbi:MAG TPA: UDP-N-acetylmuramate dehydrogenase [Bryobacteraceae bacterium]|nr:UDP-N-acetylmuramate dehydrogenase [Bryobacteraceae bacterium]
MTAAPSALARLEAVPNLTILRDEPLAVHTRFGIGGPASIYMESRARSAFLEALRVVKDCGLPWIVIGGGSNLVVADAGFPGIVLRYRADEIRRGPGNTVSFDAGAELQALVDFSISEGLAGLHTMTRIPGSAGGAVYGNAGAYGRSISESISTVTLFDGGKMQTVDNAACQFHYRESIFKKRKEWIILSATVELTLAPEAELRRTADDIRKIRDEKYPPTMKCAGSIFKNLILSELSASIQARVPAGVIREGKVPSAYFLEQVGAKGLRKGGIEVAPYHANLIYNTGNGTARELIEVIADLKKRVAAEFGLALEEEVQYVGVAQ